MTIEIPIHGKTVLILRRGDGQIRVQYICGACIWRVKASDANGRKNNQSEKLNHLYKTKYTKLFW